MLAILGGLAFALPWAGHLALFASGASDPRPVLWHEAHAVAGILFTGALLEIRARHARMLSNGARIAVIAAIASAVGLAIANAGEVAALGEIFVPLYGIAMLGLSGSLLALGLTARSVPRPMGSLLTAIGVAFLASLPLGALPEPAGVLIGYSALVGYGLLWVALGAVILRLRPAAGPERLT